MCFEDPAEKSARRRKSVSTPSMTETKEMPVTTPFLVPKKAKNPLFSEKIKLATTRQGVCLRCLDGSFCAIKTGLKTVLF